MTDYKPGSFPSKKEIFDILRSQEWFRENRKTTHGDMWDVAGEIKDLEKEKALEGRVK